MTSADETLAAATAIIQGLAKGVPGVAPSAPPFDFKFPPSVSNGCESKTIHLPGAPSAAKTVFEKELEALARRVHYLEFQAVSL